MTEPAASAPDQESRDGLIAYALRCAEAESARMIAPPKQGPGDPPGHPLPCPEAPVTGRAGFARAPAALAARPGGLAGGPPGTIAAAGPPW